MNQKLIDKTFEPEYFNNSDLNKLLANRERAIFRLPLNNEENKLLYETFFRLLNEHIAKFTNSTIKNLILDLQSGKNIVYLGLSIENKNEPIFSRLLISRSSNSLYGIILDLHRFNVSKYDTNSLIELFENLSQKDFNMIFYILYYSLIRSAVLLNHKEIMSNMDLHKLMIRYLYLLVLKSIGSKIISSDRQKLLLNFTCAYLYFRHFLEYKHINAVSTIRKIIDLNKDFFQEYADTINIISKYNDIKDIGKILIDLKVINMNPSQIIISLYKVLTSVGFFSITSCLDIFIGMAILSKYPTNLFDKSTETLDTLHSSIENIILPLINKIKYKKL
jgi:hypothetical protein